jgi:hypothetical protein
MFGSTGRSKKGESWLASWARESAHGEGQSPRQDAGACRCCCWDNVKFKAWSRHPSCPEGLQGFIFTGEGGGRIVHESSLSKKVSSCSCLC